MKEILMNPSVQRNAALCVLALVLLVSYRSCRGKEADLAAAEQNVAALTDSVRTVTTKNGELEAARLSLATSAAGLRKLNAGLAAELEAERGKVRVITRTSVTHTTDTLWLTNTLEVLPGGELRLVWQHDTVFPQGGSQRIAGWSSFRVDSAGPRPGRTVITRDELALSIIVGFRERPGDGKLEIFARSKTPGVEFSDIEGAVVDIQDLKILENYRPSCWSVALQGGGGLTAGASGELLLRPYIGVGISYDIITF